MKPCIAKPVLLIALLAFVSVGCTTRIGDLTVASTRLVNLDRVDLDQMPSKRRIRGSDIKWHVFLIPIGLPHLEDAFDDALDKGQGDVMTDITIHQRAWTVLLFGQSGLLVTGDVIDTRERSH